MIARFDADLGQAPVDLRLQCGRAARLDGGHILAALRNGRHGHDGGLNGHGLHSAPTGAGCRPRSLFLASRQCQHRQDAADTYKIPFQRVTLTCQVFSNANKRPRRLWLSRTCQCRFAGPVHCRKYFAFPFPDGAGGIPRVAGGTIVRLARPIGQALALPNRLRSWMFGGSACDNAVFMAG